MYNGIYNFYTLIFTGTVVCLNLKLFRLIFQPFLNPNIAPLRLGNFQLSFWISEFWIDFGTSTRCPICIYIYIYTHTQCFSWFRVFTIIQDAKTIQKVWKGRSSTTSPLRKKHVYFLAPPWPVGMASKLGTSCHPQGTWSWLDDAREYPHFRSFRKRPYIYNIYICIIYICIIYIYV